MKLNQKIPAIHHTVKSALVESIRDEIIQGHLPPGEWLRLEEIAERYTVSTMPVREALRQLEAEGLVEIFPHRGSRVSLLSAAELADIYDTRAALEEMATSLAVPHLTETIFEALTTCLVTMDNHPDDILLLNKLNERFHSTLYAPSGRRHLCEMINILRCRSQHYYHAYMVDLGGMAQSQAEHWAILEVCRKGEADQAAGMMRRHVGRVRNALVEYIQQRETSTSAI